MAGWDPKKLAPPAFETSIGEALYKTFLEAASSEAAWAFFVQRIVAEVPGATPDEKLAMASTSIQNADMNQLACKLIINSIYGFTGAGRKSAKLMLTEISAATTAIGRRVLSNAKAMTEALTPQYIEDAIQTAKPLNLWNGPHVHDVLTALKPLRRLKVEEETDGEEEDTEEEEEEHLKRKYIAFQTGLLEESHRATLAWRTNPDDEEARMRAQRASMKRLLEVEYGDTDSIMIKHPSDPTRRTAQERHEMTTRAAKYEANFINAHQPGIMKIVFEKMSRMTLFIDAKNYIMAIVGKKLLAKGVEVARGDTIPFTNRVISTVMDRLLLKSTPESFDSVLREMVEFVKREFLALARGQVEIAELIKRKRLARISYVSPPEHARVAEKMRARGDRVDVGESIEYVYTKHVDAVRDSKSMLRLDRGHGRVMYDDLYSKQRGGDIAEHVGYVLQHHVPLDYEHYYHSAVKNPVCKFFRHILAPRQYPHLDDMMGEDDMTRVETQRAAIREEQNTEVERILCTDVERYLSQLRERQLQRSINTTRIDQALIQRRKVDCTMCAESFLISVKKATAAAATTTPLACDKCTSKADDMLNGLRAKAVETTRRQDVLTSICRACIRVTGFSELIDIEKCTKYDCPVYDERRRLAIMQTQNTSKQETIQRILAATTTTTTIEYTT